MCVVHVTDKIDRECANYKLALDIIQGAQVTTKPKKLDPLHHKIDHVQTRCVAPMAVLAVKVDDTHWEVETIGQKGVQLRETVYYTATL